MFRIIRDPSSGGHLHILTKVLLIMLLSMHGSTMKLSNTQQAKIINNYQNTRLKLLKTNAAVWFNRMCKIKQVKPNYIHFRTNRKTRQDIKTVLQATQYRITQEINPYPTAFPYGNGMVLHFYQQQESSTTKTVHRVINKGLKAYV